MANSGNEEDAVKNEGNGLTKTNVCEVGGSISCACSGHNTVEEEGRNCRDSDEIIDSWTWGEQPTISGLNEAVHSLMVEQLELISEASKSTPSSVRLHQRLLVLERYYIACISGSSSCSFAQKDDTKNAQKNEKNSR